MSLHGFYVRFQNISFQDIFLSDIQTIFGNGFADRKSGPVYIGPGEIVFLALTSDVARSFEFGTIRGLTDQGLATSIILAGSDMNLIDGVPVFIGATPLENGEVGLVPQPLAGQDTLYLRGDGSWAPAPTAPDPFIGASSMTNGEEGLVPQPLMGEEDFFLKGDGTWSPAPGAIGPFTGATPVADGTEGLVPLPLAGQESYLLFGDGTWKPDPSPTPAPFTGATMIDDGAEGLVPQPLAGQDTSVLMGDGTWQDLLFPPAYEVIVLNNGDDASADGSPYRPFQTITAAIDFINNTPGADSWVLKVGPGDYSAEAPVTLTRARVHIIGDSHSPYSNYIVRLPCFIINPLVDLGGISENEISFYGVTIAGQGSQAIEALGTFGYSLYLQNVSISITDTNQQCLLLDNTVGVRVKIVNCVLENNNTNGTNIQVNCPGSLDCFQSVLNCGISDIVNVNSSNFAGAFHKSVLEGQGTYGISQNGNSTVHLLQSSLTLTSPNSTGVFLQGTSQFTALGSSFTVPVTLSGYVVDGPGTCTFFYDGSNSYLGTTRVHNTLTVTLVPNSISLVV